MMSYTALWKCVFLSRNISVIVFRRACFSVTLLSVLFQVSPGCSYLFNPSSTPIVLPVNEQCKTMGKNEHIHVW